MRRTKGLTNAVQAISGALPCWLDPPWVPLAARRSLGRAPSRCLHLRGSVSHLRTNQPSLAPSKGPPRNEEITDPYVRLVNAEGGLDPPTTLQVALRSFDRSTHYLQQVAPAQRGVPAICKVMSIRAARETREMERARRKAQKISSREAKELELNWAIDAHDLSHRLDKMQEFLEKGMRVDVMLAGKRRGRKATLEEAEQLLARIRDRLQKIDGAAERKEAEGKILGQMTLFLAGKLTQ